MKSEQAITALGRLLGWLEEPSARQAEHAVVVRPLTAADGDAVVVEAKARDISRGGIRLKLEAAFNRGALLSVDFPGVITVLATVIHAAPEDAGQVLDCIFTSELDDEHLRAFGARQQRATAADKRRWVRFPCDAKAFYHLAADPKPVERLGQVINISPSGISLLAAQPADIGAVLGMRLPDKNGEHALLMLGCVVRCTPQAEGEHALGCVFIRELSHEEFAELKE